MNRETAPCRALEDKMASKLEQQIELTRKTNRSLAEFVEISVQEEIDAGVRESIVTSKWLQKLTGSAE